MPTQQCAGITNKQRQCLRRIKVKVKPQHNGGQPVFCKVHQRQCKTEPQRPDTETKQTVPQSQQQPPLVRDLFECECCCECFAHDRVTCTQQHAFCKRCLRTWVQEKLASGSSDIRCLSSVHGQCPGTFNPQALQSALPFKVYTAWSHKNQQDNVRQAQLADLRTCPRCRCYAAVIDDADARLMQYRLQCRNAECRHNSCLRCMQKYHGTGPCLALADAGVRKTVEETLSACRIRRCPNPACQNLFLRQDGCNKMTCSLCKQLSYYLCQQRIDGYEHFAQPGQPRGCPLYTNEADIQQQALHAAIRQLQRTYASQSRDRQVEARAVLHELERQQGAVIDRVWPIPPPPPLRPAKRFFVASLQQPLTCVIL